MIILPSTYLGSIEYFAHLIKDGSIIDIYEHFIKRSQRNRAEILSANGILSLTVQVCKSNSPRTPIRDMKIDYSKRWQHQHWLSLVSAYNSSPFFEYYRDYLEPFYTKEYKYLVDYNLELTHLILRLIGSDVMPVISEAYVEGGEFDVDLRPKNRVGSTFSVEPYIQLFAAENPTVLEPSKDAFTANLSLVDLLFSEGPNSISILKSCNI